MKPSCILFSLAKFANSRICTIYIFLLGSAAALGCVGCAAKSSVHRVHFVPGVQDTIVDFRGIHNGRCTVHHIEFDSTTRHYIVVCREGR
jgi:hypothetical protein